MKDLLIVHDWIVVKKGLIEDPRAGNIEKFWMEPLPGFQYEKIGDQEEFPWMVCSGKESINLVNVKTHLLMPLI